MKVPIILLLLCAAAFALPTGAEDYGDPPCVVLYSNIYGFYDPYSDDTLTIVDTLLTLPVEDWDSWLEQRYGCK